MMKCPICASPAIKVSEERSIRLGKREAVVLDEFLRCTACEEEFYAPGQLAATHRRASAAIRERLGILQAEEIQAIRTSLGLSQDQFERLLGVGAKTVVRWERGTVFQNRATDTLLRLIRDVPEVSRILAQDRGVELRPDRASWAGSPPRTRKEAPSLLRRAVATEGYQSGTWGDRPQHGPGSPHGISLGGSLSEEAA